MLEHSPLFYMNFQKLSVTDTAAVQLQKFRHCWPENQGCEASHEISSIDEGVKVYQIFITFYKIHKVEAQYKKATPKGG